MLFWAPRLLAYVFVALATVLLGFIARLEFGKGFALPAMWLATPMILLPGIDQFPANTEMFLLLPLLATVAIYCFSHQQGISTAILVLGGVFCGHNDALQIHCASGAGVCICGLVAEMLAAKQSLGGTAFFAFTGGLVAAILILGYF